MKTKVNVRGPGQFKKTVIRQVRKIGNALYVSLPKPYCRKNNIQAKDEVLVVSGESLRITPINKGVGDE